jgi:RNA polymerase sporulation-specific sigma factor
LDLATDVAVSPEDAMILRDDRMELRQKMSKALSDFEFKVTTMYMDGMSCAEICEATGKTAKSVDNAIQRSKRKLQEVLKK